MEAITPPSIKRSVPVMIEPSRPIRNAAVAPISSGVPTRQAADALIIRWYAGSSDLSMGEAQLAAGVLIKE